MKILFLCFGVLVALPAFNQTKELITGQNLMIQPMPISGYQLLSGKNIVKKTTTDFNLINGASLQFNWPADSAKIINMIGDKTKVGKITLSYTDNSTPVPPGTIPTVTVTASNSANGGTYSYPVTMSGQKTLAINYALAPGGNPANATVTMTHNGVAVWRGELTPTAGWADYQTKTFAIPVAIGSGTLTVVINRGLNPRTYTFSK